jgi:hypothetical protein
VGPFKKARVKAWQKPGKQAKEKGGKMRGKKSGSVEHLKIAVKCMEKMLRG